MGNRPPSLAEKEYDIAELADVVETGNRYALKWGGAAIQ
jgi:hypothetical protein